MPKPLATWNPARDVWETPQTEGLFCEHLDVYSETFPTSGMTANGAAYELPTWEHHTGGSGSSSLLPTVTTSDTNGPGKHGDGGMDLRTTVSLLPTPVAQPSGNTPENHLRKKPGRQIVTDLSIIVENGLLLTGGKLLPTPAAMDGSGGRITKEKGGFRESGAKRSITLSTAVHHDLPPTGANTDPRSDAGSQLWEDVPLPLLNPQDATADTVSAPVSRNG